jgi:L-2-hydroxyglutarate oxidase
MEALFERAKQNGIVAERIDHVGLMQLEPNVTGVAALLIPSTGIVDYKMISAALAKIVSAEGTEIELGTEVVAIHEDPHAIEIPTASPNWPASRSIIASCRFEANFIPCQNLGQD